MQELNAKEIRCADEGKVRYEIEWTVPNWRGVNQDRAIFETGLEPRQLFQTKWLVGLDESSQVYWQLLDVKGPGSQLELDVEITTIVCVAPGSSARPLEDKQKMKMSMFQVFKSRERNMDLLRSYSWFHRNYIDTKGAVKYTLGLTFKTPVVDSAYFEKIRMEEFYKQSNDQLRKNQASILSDTTKGDLKIITSDKVELFGHQIILKAQCPVFAGMLNSVSDFSESKTGIVKVDDISGKTMTILLRYFYTGDLLDSWRDLDTIVEFVYAAGKYQMTKVLELMDDLLGKRNQDQDEVSSLDIELLNLTWKLSLKQAEKRILQRIVRKITTIKSSEELFQLLGQDSEEIYSKADEQFGDSFLSESLKILDNTLKNSDNTVFSHPRGLTLLALIQKNELNALEQTLLKRLVEIASKITTADELFKLFGNGV